MSICFLSKESEEKEFVLVQRQFITEFMPTCTHTQLSVYLYGLHLCNIPSADVNALDNMCDCLSITSEEIHDAFVFLSSLGLTTITNTSPLSVRYEKIKEFNPTKTFSKEKYSDFNEQYINIFETTAQVNPNNFLVYYEFMEETKISPEVMIMIIRYCVSKKGEKLPPSYILTVARDWVSSGVRTIKSIEQKIMQLESATESLAMIARELGKRTENTFEDKQLYLKWTSSWGFDLPAILAACKLCKKKGGMARLDKILDELFNVNAITVADIDAFAINKQMLYDNAYAVNKKLGLYIENVEIYVEKYISAWHSNGFEFDAIQAIADFCFDCNINSYEGMNSLVNKFSKSGCLTREAIGAEVARHADINRTIKTLVEATGSSRAVSASDRDLYRIWSVQFNMPYDVINYACTLALGKPYAFGYAHNILSKWNAANVNTLAAAKAFALTSSGAPGGASSVSKASQEFNANDRKFTKEDLSSFFDDPNDLDNIDV